jgi:hypothetical protein
VTKVITATTAARVITVIRVIISFTGIVITMVARVIRAVWIIINHKAITDNSIGSFIFLGI